VPVRLNAPRMSTHQTSVPCIPLWTHATSRAQRSPTRGNSSGNPVTVTGVRDPVTDLGGIPSESAYAGPGRCTRLPSEGLVTCVPTPVISPSKRRAPSMPPATQSTATSTDAHGARLRVLVSRPGPRTGGCFEGAKITSFSKSSYRKSLSRNPAATPGTPGRFHRALREGGDDREAKARGGNPASAVPSLFRKSPDSAVGPRPKARHSPERSRGQQQRNGGNYPRNLEARRCARILGSPQFRSMSRALARRWGLGESHAGVERLPP